MPAREIFYDYVKPVLVAGGMEWDVVEGRREGDVRFAVAERIRQRRRRLEDRNKSEEDDPVAVARRSQGTKDWEGVAGDLVLGRHAWKEHVRGTHEGWLGPLEQPAQSESSSPVEAQQPAAQVETIDEGTTTAKETSAEGTPKDDEAEKQRKLLKPAPFIPVKDYASTEVPRSTPAELDPTAIIQLPHILGFTKTPIRLWRFLNKREVADDIGRQTAAIVLGTASRPFQATRVDGAEESEQQALLHHEESEWHKSIRKRVTEEGKEDLWRDPVVLDERLASRMRRFVLSDEDERRAEQFFVRPKTKEESD